MNIWRHWKDGPEDTLGRTWCAPCEAMTELERRLRYEETVSREDALSAASIIACYTVLVELSERDRRPIVREIRKGPSIPSSPNTSKAPHG